MKAMKNLPHSESKFELQPPEYKARVLTELMYGSVSLKNVNLLVR
jgi:hypothetical protein